MRSQVFTPAYYVQYFKLMQTWADQGQKFDKEMIRKAQAYFATFGIEGDM